MGLLTPNSSTDFQSLYVLQFRYLLSTETQIVMGLESMITHTSNAQLKQAFQTHWQETQVHVSRLEALIAEVNDGDAVDKKDPIATALIGSGENIVSESEEGPVRDAGLLATAQKVEHYEIASYGSARDWAIQLGLQNHAEILQTTLDEEEHTDELLTSISQRVSETAVAVG